MLNRIKENIVRKWIRKLLYRNPRYIFQIIGEQANEVWYEDNQITREEALREYLNEGLAKAKNRGIIFEPKG